MEKILAARRQLLAVALLSVFHIASAQKMAYNKDGLFFYPSNDSSSYFKFNFLIQAWARYNENNPGSTVENTPQSQTLDFGIRRARFIISGQLSPKTYFFVQFGQNSLSYLSARKSGAFFHDIVAEYHVLNKELHIGGGLMGWDGVSRYSNSGVSSILCLETPSIAESNSDINDQNVRKFGIYAKGSLGRVDYQLALAKPFVIQTAVPPPDGISKNSTWSTAPPQLEFQTYVRYQFFERESILDPGAVGTYLGAKKVFNIGAGFAYQHEAMYHLNGADTAYDPMVLFAVDAFADLPLNATKGNALTLYGGYFNYNYGQGYIHNFGAMNPATGVIPSLGSFNGPGNAYPLYGTGNAIYFQGGYLLARKLFRSGGTLQPYFDFLHAKYDRLNDAVNVFDIGLNWLLEGRRTKITFNYQLRPIFYQTGGGLPSHSSNKSQWVLQFQLAL